MDFIDEPKKIDKTMPGWCRGIKYDAGNDVCKACFISEKCAKEYFLNISRSIGEDDQEEPKVLRLPKTFKAVENAIYKLSPMIGKFSKETVIVYKFKNRRLLSVVQPVSPETITVMFHHRSIKDFDDPKGLLWCGQEPKTERPFMFIKKGQLKYAIGIIKQAFDKLEGTDQIFGGN